MLLVARGMHRDEVVLPGTPSRLSDQVVEHSTRKVERCLIQVIPVSLVHKHPHVQAHQLHQPIAPHLPAPLHISHISDSSS